MAEDLRLFGRKGQGLFAKHSLPRFQRHFRIGKMLTGRGADVDSIHILQDLVRQGLGIALTAIRARELLGGNHPPAHHPEKLVALLTQGLSVIVCDEPCSNDSSSHRRYLFPLS